MPQATGRDHALRERSARVIPNGMYGHLDATPLSPWHPQFYEQGQGSRVWDADGNSYVDLMCSFGPMVLGHAHPEVQAAAAAQMTNGDCLNGPTERMVELAELIVDTVPAADWAMFAKNGTDATTIAVTTARAATGRRKVLAARGSYHGSDPWCTPKPAGTLPEDRAHLHYFEYNDLRSAERAAAEAGDDLAAIIVTPIRHDLRRDLELADPEFARGLRQLCDRTGAALILDDVRCGLRLDIGGSWEPLGVRPDLAAWSKAIANGYALAAVTGTDALRTAASEIYVTGSFWFSAVAMAASVATLTRMRDDNGPALIERAGRQLRDGLHDQAAEHGLRIRQTGPAQMPLLSFTEDPDFAKALLWTGECARRGVIVHPWHNWFLSAAHSDADIAEVLDVTGPAFAEVRARYGP